MSIDEFLEEWRSESPTVEVRTSGSTGTPKVMHAEKARMLASARMTCDFLGLKPGDNALLCLPLDYIAGKMMVVRSIERGMNLLCVEPSGHPFHNGQWIISPPICPSSPSSPNQTTKQRNRSVAEQTLRSSKNETTKQRISLAAMVPLQVWNTLQVPEEKEALCRHVRHLIIGGGAIPPELEQELCTLPIQAWSSYGMTETLSHIALRRVGEKYYTPLPGITLEQDNEGCLIIDVQALHPGKLVTNDIVEFHDATHFRVLGRRDNTVCSGGIKIQIEEVEEWLHSIGIKDVAVTWVPDPRLGQALVYLTSQDINASPLHDIKSTHSCPIPERPDSRYWLPRDIIRMDTLPLTPTGKPDRAKALKIARGYNNIGLQPQ